MKVCQWCGNIDDSIVENKNLGLTLCVNCWEEAVNEAQESMNKAFIKKEEGDLPHLYNFFHK